MSLLGRWSILHEVGSQLSSTYFVFDFAFIICDLNYFFRLNLSGFLSYSRRTLDNYIWLKYQQYIAPRYVKGLKVLKNLFFCKMDERLIKKMFLSYRSIVFSVYETKRNKQIIITHVCNTIFLHIINTKILSKWLNPPSIKYGSTGKKGRKLYINIRITYKKNEMWPGCGYIKW